MCHATSRDKTYHVFFDGLLELHANYFSRLMVLSHIKYRGSKNSLWNIYYSDAETGKAIAARFSAEALVGKQSVYSSCQQPLKVHENKVQNHWLNV